MQEHALVLGAQAEQPADLGATPWNARKLAWRKDFPGALEGDAKALPRTGKNHPLRCRNGGDTFWCQNVSG